MLQLTMNSRSFSSNFTPLVFGCNYKLKNSRRFSSISYSLHYSYTVQFDSPRIPGPSHQFPIYYTSVYVIYMVQLCYEFQNILVNIIIHSTTLFNHPRIPKHLINFSSIPLVYGAMSQKN